jgi:hypothetical protein
MMIFPQPKILREHATTISASPSERGVLASHDWGPREGLPDAVWGRPPIFVRNWQVGLVSRTVSRN